MVRCFSPIVDTIGAILVWSVVEKLQTESRAVLYEDFIVGGVAVDVFVLVLSKHTRLYAEL